MTGVLSDLRVIDATGPIGHYAGRLLAELGADVIKVEPRGGDPARRWAPLLPETPEPEAGLQFILLNAGKRGVVLDLEDEWGREAFLRLLETADVLLESWSLDDIARLRLDEDTLTEARDDLIRCSLTGWGLSGPYAGWAYADIVADAMSGVMQLAGFPDGPPEQLPNHQGYHSASINGAAGVMAALLHRDATGEGQRVEVSMQEALLMAEETAMQGADILGTDRGRTGGQGQLPIKLPALGVYEAQDGYIYSMCTGNAGSGFRGLVGLMTDLGYDHGLDDEPYASFIAESMSTAQILALIQDPDRVAPLKAMLGEMDEAVTGFFRQVPKEQLYIEGQARRVLIGPVNGPREISESVQLEARDWFRELEDPARGKRLRYPGPPWMLTATPAVLSRPAPLLGEHTAEVLRDLGYSDAEAAELASAAQEVPA